MTDTPAADAPPLFIAVVIPCYRETNHILDVIAEIGPEVGAIYVIDDACPDGTGALVETNCRDERVKVIRHERNKGVGGATITGYSVALAGGAEIIVKLDGDGQMDPALISELIHPIVEGRADYTKGNRLHRRDAMRGMPKVRLFGNMALTLMTKLSSGYWPVMDPTNGFTAIHAAVAAELPLEDIAEGFFFETDVLFRLAGLEAVVKDVPMHSKYGTEESHLSVHRVIFEFLGGHARNGLRRIIDTYFIRDVGIASLELILGSVLLLFGTVFGTYHWWRSVADGIPATAGTVILAALPVLVGVQMLLAFIGNDIRRVPDQPIHPSLRAAASHKQHGR